MQTSSHSIASSSQVANSQVANSQVSSAQVSSAQPKLLRLIAQTVLNPMISRIQTDSNYLRHTVKRIHLLLQETEAIVTEISQIAAAAAAEHPPDVDYSNLLDVRQSGAYQVKQQTLFLTDRTRPESIRPFRVLTYQPIPWRSPQTPVVVISHGYGSRPEAYGDYARHLASHGYFVAIPQHPGSDSEYLKLYLKKYVHKWWRSRESVPFLIDDPQQIRFFKLEEFIDRPRDISFVLDELERRNDSCYEGQLNVQRVGLLGHSLGGYTAIALAGASLNFADLQATCDLMPGLPNLSLLLQCRALELPRQIYQLRDPRVQAIIPIDPVGSEVFGAAGLSQIQVPVMIVAGSDDTTTPAIFEQIRLFPWLTTDHRYLALIKGKSHVGNYSDLDAGLKLILRWLTNLRGPDSALFYSYTYALSLSFFETHLLNNAGFQPYLQSAYAQSISQSPFDLYLISGEDQQTCHNIDQRLRTFIAQITTLSE
jgi:predicted dienelactone hydrolase